MRCSLTPPQQMNKFVKRFYEICFSFTYDRTDVLTPCCMAREPIKTIAIYRSHIQDSRSDSICFNAYNVMTMTLYKSLTICKLKLTSTKL